MRILTIAAVLAAAGSISLASPSAEAQPFPSHMKNCQKNQPFREDKGVYSVPAVRDGACSSSTLKEAASWGKVQTTHEQMVFAEATTVVPLIGSDAYWRGAWKTRKRPKWAKLFK
jgi:hypothetical protein